MKNLAMKKSGTEFKIQKKVSHNILYKILLFTHLLEPAD